MLKIFSIKSLTKSVSILVIFECVRGVVVLISCYNVAVAFWLQLPRLQELLVCRAGEQNSVITLQQGPAATTLQGPWGGAWYRTRVGGCRKPFNHLVYT